MTTFWMQGMNIGVALPEWMFNKDSKTAPLLLLGLVGVGILLPLSLISWHMLSSSKFSGPNNIMNDTMMYFLHSKYCVKESQVRRCKHSWVHALCQWRGGCCDDGCGDTWYPGRVVDSMRILTGHASRHGCSCQVCHCLIVTLHHAIRTSHLGMGSQHCTWSLLCHISKLTGTSCVSAARATCAWASPLCCPQHAAGMLYIRKGMHPCQCQLPLAHHYRTSLFTHT